MRNKNRETAFFIACLLSHREIAVILLSYGADPWIANSSNRDACSVAAQTGNAKILSVLLNCNTVSAAYPASMYDNQSLHYSIAGGSLQCAKLLLGHGWSVNSTDSSGRTPLMIAAINGRTEIIHALLSTSKIVNTRLECQQGRNALVYAVRACNKAVVSKLLELDAHWAFNIRNVLDAAFRDVLRENQQQQRGPFQESQPVLKDMIKLGKYYYF